MKRIVGVFQTEDQAVKAIRDLKTQGYKGEEISVVTKDKADFAEIKELAGNVRREKVQTDEVQRNEIQRDEFKKDDVQRDEFQRDDVTRDELQRDEFQRDEFQRDEFQRDEFHRDEDSAVYNVSSGEGTGSFIKTLKSYGVSETEALKYEDEVNAGNIMVLLGFGEIIKGHIENPGTYTDPLIGDEIIETPGAINILEEMGGENETPGTFVDPISPTEINETPGTINDPFVTHETETPGTFTLDDDKDKEI